MILLLLTLLLPLQTRDVTPARTGTAMLSGIVTTDEPSRRPIGRATVTLVSTGANRNPQITATDDNGRFTFSNLPAGNFTLVAQKPPYVPTYYGAKRPGATVGVPLAIADGQRLTDVTLRMLRGAVITGTVFDESGRPMPAVGVRVRQMTVSPSGARTPAATIGSVVPSTDDRGVYRVYGLAPGDYLVSIQPRVAGAGELRQTTSAELQWAEQQLRSTSSAMSTGAVTTTPPAAGGTVTYASVYYPDTADGAAATLVNVGVGQERGGIDIRSQLIPTARVDGTVTDPNGQPAAGVQVSLLPHESSVSPGAQDLSRLLAMAEVFMVSATTARTSATGAFSLAGVAPGSYMLMASTAARAGPARGTGPSSTGFWAMTDLTVSGQDISDVALTLAPGMTVSGRFTFEGKTLPAEQARISITINAMQSSAASVVGAVNLNPSDPVFFVTGLAPGRYRFGASVGAWTLASAMLAGRDVADTPFEIKPGENVSNLAVTFTDSPAQLSGRLTDAADRPAPSLVLLLFTTDRSLWYTGSRRLRPPLGPASDGAFSFNGLTPGEYYLAALTDVSPTEWFDPSFLEQAALSAIKITVAGGEKKVQDVKIGR